MAKSYRTAIRIDMFCIIGDAESSERCETLGGKCFVEFDDVHLLDRETGDGKHLLKNFLEM